MSVHEFAAENGFNVLSVLYDGKIHRIPRHGKKDVGWYVAHSNGYAIFGDWRTGEKLHYRNGVMSTNVDIGRIKAEREERRIEEEKKKASAIQTTVKIIATASDTSIHPYMSRKGFDQNYGAKISKQGDLIVPVRNIKGLLTGGQTITPDGRKKFIYGTEIKGSFFSVPIWHDFSDVIVCEGFATAVSCHIASGLPAIAAFSCGNLEPVVKSIREKFPDATITVCGDNDQWTEGNPGVSSSRYVAKYYSCYWCVPKFRKTHDKPTDFNDLHALEGIDKVTAQISNAYKYESKKEYHDRCKINGVVPRW